MGYPAARVEERAHLARIDVHAVGRDDLCFQQTLLLDVGDDRHALLGTHVFDFIGSLGNVRVERYIEFQSNLRR